jgi:predicted phosphoribosyltransferase
VRVVLEEITDGGEFFEIHENWAANVVCALAPETFLAVGNWYDDFSQTSDEEVRELLRATESPVSAHPGQ